MSEVRVYARKADGTEVEVTEGVQALYDLVIGSMNWGSGFLTVEDAEPVVHVAKTCGFANWQVAQRYVDAERASQEQAAFLRSFPPRPPFPYLSWVGVPHEHVYSSRGRCMWPSCGAEKS